MRISWSRRNSTRFPSCSLSWKESWSNRIPPTISVSQSDRQGVRLQLTPVRFWPAERPLRPVVLLSRSRRKQKAFGCVYRSRETPGPNLGPGTDQTGQLPDRSVSHLLLEISDRSPAITTRQALRRQRLRPRLNTSGTLRSPEKFDPASVNERMTRQVEQRRAAPWAV